MFDINCNNFSCHHRNVTKDTSSSLSLLLLPKLVSDTLHELNISFRIRLFTPFLTLYTFLSQIFNDDGSCKRAVGEVNAQRFIKNLKPCSFGTSSFCKAKARLPIAFFKLIMRKLSIPIQSASNETWEWKHGKVKVVDGTTFAMPDTPINVSYFSGGSNKKSQSTFPLGRLSAVFSLSTGAIIDAAIAPFMGKGNGELSLLNKQWECFEENDTLLADCLYSCYVIVASAKKRGINIVAEFNSKGSWRLSKKKHDQLITITKPQDKSAFLTDEEFSALPPTVTVRIVRLSFAPKGFRTKNKLILTTHLDSKIVPSKDISELYKRRWQVELNLRSIKTILGMDTLKGKSSDMVEKEVWVYLIAYNLIRLAMVKTAKNIKRAPTELSFRCALQAFTLIRSMNLFAASINFESFLVNMIASIQVGKRPDRYEPRALKRRQNTYIYLNGTRKKAKEKFHKKRRGAKKAIS